MYSKANFCVNILLIIALLLAVVSCASFTRENSRNPEVSARSPLQSGFALPQQKAPPDNIQSIHLHPEDEPGKAPVLELNSQQKLVLSFDYLGERSRQFRLELSHRTQTWQQSTIPPSTYLDSFSQTYISNARESISQPPSYFHVEFAFPNNEMQPAVSGNYLLEVYDYSEGNLLFSIPFFITENEGTVNTRVERLFAERVDGRPLHQLFSTYRYPGFVAYPQYDLSMSFVQNRFWGRMRQAHSLDTITPGQLNGRLSREQAFIGNYEFKTLDLRNFSSAGRQILEFRPGSTPPVIVLRRDVQHLDTSPRYFPTTTNFGFPLSDRNSNYARVKFSFDTDSSVTASSDIYIIGHFNNWMINDLNKMTYNSDTGLWEGDALIKQGQYAYKYVLVRNNTIQDLALDQGFLSSEQEYLTFVYYRDPDRYFDRLLKVDHIIRR